MAKRIPASDLNVPSYAHEIAGGYPVHVTEEFGWDLVAYVYCPMMPSPRPRVTSRGTFMPNDYKKHCEKLAASLAYARGLLESGHFGNIIIWDALVPFKLDIAFWSEKQRGDLDNCAKTIMDAAQLHRGEPPGAELWKNDSQIRNLSVEWCPTDDITWEQAVVRVVRSAKDAIADAPKPTRASIRKAAGVKK